MKIQIVSDLHLWDDISVATFPVRASVLVIAGDVGRLHQVEATAEWAGKHWKDVIFVPGNHEYYDSRLGFEDTRKELHRMFERFGNVHLLDNSTVAIRGQRFVGSTLWSRHDWRWPRDRCDMLIRIKCEGRSVIDLIDAENAKCKDFLRKTVRPGDVVITHFMPVQPKELRAKGVPYPFEPSTMDTYFGNHGLDEVMAKAKLWISGHTHCAFDTSAFGCRWICNAMGHAIEDTGADQNGIVVES